MKRITDFFRPIRAGGVRAPGTGMPMVPPQVAAPLAVIGDIHGRADLLERMLVRLDQEAPGAERVFLGDYIDRGEASASVLLLLHATGARCLMGNHEAMLLAFLDDPLRMGQYWLRHGGMQTLASHGLRGLVPRPEPARLTELRAALAEALGPRADWLRNLPLWYQSGTLACVHAGADPELPLDQQARQRLLWGPLARGPRADGLWLAHGHVVVDAPQVIGGRIALDTGAWATGRLSAAVLAPDEPLRFVTVQA